MIKVYSGNKCIIISEKELKGLPKGGQVHPFVSAESVHKEYKKFISSKLKWLHIQGPEETCWRVFRSLFVFIQAAGGLVFNPKGELLMIYRNGHWDLPKGKMEKGESPNLTAVREVEEECSIKGLKIVRPLPSTAHIFSQNRNDCIKFTHWFEMDCDNAEKPTPQKEEGIKEAKWMKKSDVKKNLKKVYPSLREVLDPFIA